MTERTGLVTMKGKPMTLAGNEVEVGDKTPDFEAVANDLSAVRFSAAFKDKICIISSVTSLDTSVCSTETKRFSDEADRLGPDVAILTISMDLPFAQKRWAEKSGVTNIHFLSDHRNASFGEAYGVLLKEVRLLARTVFVTDQEGVVRYMQLVKEVANEPNYEEVLNAVKQLVPVAAGSRA